MAEFSELKQAVYAFSGRGEDIPNQVFDFATDELNRELRIIPMERVSPPIPVVDSMIALPDDFLELIQVKQVGVADGDRVRVLSPIRRTTESQERGGNYNTDCATNYILRGNALQLVPECNSGEYEIVYFRKLMQLSEDGHTNDALENGMIDAYTYLALANNAISLQNAEGAAVWANQAATIIRKANMQAIKTRTSGGTVQIRSDNNILA